MTKSTKIRIEAEDAASAVFDKLGQTVGKDMGEISKAGHFAVEFSSRIAELTRELTAGSKAGQAFAEDVGAVSNGLAKATGEAVTFGNAIKMATSAWQAAGKAGLAGKISALGIGTVATGVAAGAGTAVYLIGNSVISAQEEAARAQIAAGTQAAPSHNRVGFEDWRRRGVELFGEQGIERMLAGAAPQGPILDAMREQVRAELEAEERARRLKEFSRSGWVGGPGGVSASVSGPGMVTVSAEAIEARLADLIRARQLGPLQRAIEAREAADEARKEQEKNWRERFGQWRIGLENRGRLLGLGSVDRQVELERQQIEKEQREGKDQRPDQVQARLQATRDLATEEERITKEEQQQLDLVAKRAEFERESVQRARTLRDRLMTRGERQQSETLDAFGLLISGQITRDTFDRAMVDIASRFRTRWPDSTLRRMRDSSSRSLPSGGTLLESHTLTRGRGELDPEAAAQRTRKDTLDELRASRREAALQQQDLLRKLDEIRRGQQPIAQHHL